MWRGASVVKMEKLEFWKWCFGERRVGPLERARRGEEDGVVDGGHDGVGGGGNGGEVGGENGLFGGKRGRRRWCGGGVVVGNGGGDGGENGGGVGGEERWRWWVERMGEMAGQWKARAVLGCHGSLAVGWKEKERKMKEREEDRGVFIRREEIL